ncbi:unnamed protein product [Brassica rapa subsp. narinosa]
MELGIKNDFLVNTPRKTISQTVESNRVCVSCLFPICMLVSLDDLLSTGSASDSVPSSSSSSSSGISVSVFASLISVCCVEDSLLKLSRVSSMIPWFPKFPKQILKSSAMPCSVHLHQSSVSPLNDPVLSSTCSSDATICMYFLRGRLLRNFLTSFDSSISSPSTAAFDDISDNLPAKSSIFSASFIESLSNSDIKSSLMLYGGSSQEAEANALTPAKRQGTTIFNLEEHYDENSAIRNSCSTRIKKEKTDKSS